MEAVLLVASTRAITILADSFIATVAGLVLVGSIVACVAAGAIWLECCVLPDDDFTVVLVTRGAIKIATMVQRLEWRRRMPEFIRNERVGVVAAVAFERGDKMPGVLADGSIAIVA